MLTPSAVFVENVDRRRRRRPSVLLETRSARDLDQHHATSRSRACRRTTATSSPSRASRPASVHRRHRRRPARSSAAAAPNPRQVNVFIDGLSYKNDIIQGGAFMQDSSRGNPFPQNAVQEYKVLTQNYKAEYEKAVARGDHRGHQVGRQRRSTATPSTSSRTRTWWTQDDFAKERGDEKPPYERNQFGLSLGGPIIKDKLHFFLSYERNERDVVSLGLPRHVLGPGAGERAPRSSGYETGTLSAPLDSDLYFGKLSWQPAAAQTVDFSYHRRDEEEIRGFGGQRTHDGAERLPGRHRRRRAAPPDRCSATALNEASLTTAEPGVEGHRGQPRCAAPQLHRPARRRQQGLPAGPRAGQDRPARRLLLPRSTGSAPTRSRPAARQLDEVRVQQGGVRDPLLRVPPERGVAVPVPGPLRLR